MIWIQAGEGYKLGDIQLWKTDQVARCAMGGSREDSRVKVESS